MSWPLLNVYSENLDLGKEVFVIRGTFLNWKKGLYTYTHMYASVYIYTYIQRHIHIRIYFSRYSRIS